MTLKHTLYFTILAIGMFVVSCKENGNQTTAKPASDTTAKSSDKIVFIDIDTLLAKYQLYIDKKTELEGQSKTAEKALAGKIEAFQKRLARFQQEVGEIQQKANTIAPVELKKMEEKYAQQQQNLAREEEALMKQRDNAALDLEKQLQVTQKDLQDKIDEFLAKIADEKGFDFVMMKGSTGSVMYGRPSLDITNETVNRLNEEYQKSKSPEKN
jgi:outer membrane protein